MSQTLHKSTLTKVVANMHWAFQVSSTWNHTGWVGLWACKVSLILVKPSCHNHHLRVPEMSGLKTKSGDFQEMRWTKTLKLSLWLLLTLLKEFHDKFSYKTQRIKFCHFWSANFWQWLWQDGCTKIDETGHVRRSTHPVWFHIEVTLKALPIFAITLVKVDLWGDFASWIETLCRFIICLLSVYFLSIFCSFLVPILPLFDLSLLLIPFRKN